MCSCGYSFIPSTFMKIASALNMDEDDVGVVDSHKSYIVEKKRC